MEFRELDDKQWGFIEPFLPPPAGTGRPRIDDRMVFNAIVYVLTTGCRWMDLPKHFQIHYTNVWRRLKDWEEQGIWKKIMEGVIKHGYASGKLGLEIVAVDSTDVAAKKGGSSLAMMGIRRSREARSTL